MEQEIFYKGNFLIKFSTIGHSKVTTVLYCWGSWKLQCSTAYWKNKGTGTKENYIYKQSEVCMVSRWFSSYCFTVLPWWVMKISFWTLILNCLTLLLKQILLKGIVCRSKLFIARIFTVKQGVGLSLAFTWSTTVLLLWGFSTAY